MDLSNLTPAEGSVKSKGKRVGRGEGSGRGGTSARGHNGAKSRSGYSKKVGFEGGQMPLQRRVPKFGFTNINRKEFKGVNLDTIQMLATTKNLDTIDINVMMDNGLAGRNTLVKILGRGTVDSKVTVKAHAFSKSAKEAIEAKGGSTETIA
jgi:large subunit ribosomal protein L15